MQVPLEIVQAKTLVPTPRFEIEVVGDVGVSIFPEPETKVQIPVPIVGLFPAKEVVVEQIV